MMTDTELFKEVLERVCKNCNVTYEYTPIGYYIFYNTDAEVIGEANFTGYNLLAKCQILLRVLENYLK